MNENEMKIRQDYIAGLRNLADALEKYHYINLPFYGRSHTPLTIYFLGADDGKKSTMAATMKALGGRWNKEPNGDYFDCTKKDGFSIQITAYREDICERRVIGTKTETVEEVDPAEYAALPKITVEKEVDIVEWDCPPSFLG